LTLRFARFDLCTADDMMNTSAKLVQVLCLLIGTMLLSTDSHAQDPVDSAVSHVGLGAAITFYNPSSSDGKSSEGISLAYRWHTFHSGWGPTFGIDWHTTDFNQPLGSVDAPLGSLRMRALLAGFGHTRRMGRFSASASMSGGYSFNDFSVDAGAGPAFASTGISLRGVQVNNSWVAMPQVAVWYDVFKHVGVGISAAYFVTRPQEVMATAGGSEVGHLNANALELSAGLTFGVWKEK
jgi:hypothetical protein